VGILQRLFQRFVIPIGRRLLYSRFHFIALRRLHFGNLVILGGRQVKLRIESGRNLCRLKLLEPAEQSAQVGCLVRFQDCHNLIRRFLGEIVKLGAHSSIRSGWTWLAQTLPAACSGTRIQDLLLFPKILLYCFDLTALRIRQSHYR